MSDKRPTTRGDEIPTRTSSSAAATSDVIDTVRDNTVRIIDEAAKAQPQYLQSMSNLQTDYVQTTKNFVQTSFSAQKQIAQNLNIPSNTQVTEAIARQSTEITNNSIRAFQIYNQLTLNSIDVARENAKIYGRTVDTMSEYTGNMVRAWTDYINNAQQQQQQFFRRA